MARGRRSVAERLKRLLALHELLGTQGIGEATHAIAAFLSWKALLLGANTQEGNDEHERVESAIRAILEQRSAPFASALAGFAEALQVMRNSAMMSSAAQQEWLVDTRIISRNDVNDYVRRKVRRIEKFARHIHGQESLSNAELASLICDMLFTVRHATLAHFSATTGTPGYDRIVPSFDKLCTRLAEGIAVWLGS